jgi:hypothetical protein
MRFLRAYYVPSAVLLLHPLGEWRSPSVDELGSHPLQGLFGATMIKFCGSGEEVENVKETTSYK